MVTLLLYREQIYVLWNTSGYLQLSYWQEDTEEEFGVSNLHIHEFWFFSSTLIMSVV